MREESQQVAVPVLPAGMPTQVSWGSNQGVCRPVLPGANVAFLPCLFQLCQQPALLGSCLQLQNLPKSPVSPPLLPSFTSAVLCAPRSIGMTGIGNFSPGQQICGLHDICSSHTLCHVKPLVCSQRLGTGCGHRGGHHSVYHKVFLPFWNLRNVSELELACSGVFWDSGTQ